MVAAQPMVVFAGLSLLAMLASWRWFWRRHANPSRRSGAAFGAIGCLTFAGFPLLWLVEAMATGQIQCLGRGCTVETYSAAQSPAAFWLSAAVLGAAGAFFLGGFLYSMAWALTRPAR